MNRRQWVISYIDITNMMQLHPKKEKSRNAVTVLFVPVHTMNTMCETLKIELVHRTVYIYLLSKKVIYLVVYCIKTVSWVHPASYTMGTGSLLGVKRSGHGTDHPPHLALGLKNS
jgi:hypothetical protein